MNDYLIRMPVHYSKNLNGKVFDITQLIKGLKYVNNEFPILETNYNMFLNINRFSDTSNSILLTIKFYDEDVNEYDLNHIKNEVFKSESQCISWIKNYINLYIANINAQNIIINYCDTEAGYISFYRFYVPIFDYSTGTKLEIPEIKETTIELEVPDVERYLK